MRYKDKEVLRLWTGLQSSKQCVKQGSFSSRCYDNTLCWPYERTQNALDLSLVIFSSSDESLLTQASKVVDTGVVGEHRR